jgi:DNA-binding winged helix-turn-helix (wHTH) protein
MQVLVALARANGGIVTRDELTCRCWDSRIVGDDAINRTLSRIRHIAAGLGTGAFEIQTIAKVGYRLVADDSQALATVEMPPEPVLTAAPAIERRHLLASALAISAISMGGTALWRRRGHQPSAEAAEFYRKGVEARTLGLMESGDQATAYFLQAVRLDPDYPAAWGALSRQFASQLGNSGDAGLDLAAGQTRSAARRALSLDPDQADAKGALAVIQPSFRRWGEYERGLLRVTEVHPGQRQALVQLGVHYGNVARWDDAIEKFHLLRRGQPFTPGTTGPLVLAYWASGRLAEAEAESVAALQRWPRFHGMWFMRMILLTYGGRPEQAVAFAENRDNHPSGANAEPAISLRLATAKALVSRNAAELSKVRERLLADVTREILNVPQAVRFFSALGERDLIFELLDAYFNRRGRFVTSAHKPIHPLSRITSDFLFHPTAQLLWADPRFASLTRVIGLDDYWRASGFVPAHLRR